MNWSLGLLPSVAIYCSTLTLGFSKNQRRRPRQTTLIFVLAGLTPAAVMEEIAAGKRFAESGARFIQVNTPNVWDQHGNLKNGHEKNSLAVDKPIAGLLTDLKQRGLLEDTLVVWGGEFGRTPIVQGNNGRDHNPQGFTMWLAGGGTDEFGYYAVKNKVHMHDLHATILHLLGLNHERLTHRYAGRDFRLTNVYGHVVREIIG